MFKIKGPVLAAITFDDVAGSVLRQADALATFYKTEFHVCHVLGEICASRPLFPYLHMEDALRVADLEALVRKELLKSIRTKTSRKASDVSIAIEQGTVHSGILRAAEDIGAGMIVVGGKKEETSMPVLGGIAERVMRHAHCPVFLARPSRKRTGKVLAATDFSDPSLPAIETGVAESRRLNTDLAIVHSIDLLPILLPAIEGVAHPALPPGTNAYIREASQRELDDCVRRYKVKKGILYEGEAAEGILKTAVDISARLLVVGTHGRTGLSRLALGSVAEAVLRASPCSVLIVRTKK